jgi:hypothetical protein
METNALEHTPTHPCTHNAGSLSLTPYVAICLRLSPSVCMCVYRGEFLVLGIMLQHLETHAVAIFCPSLFALSLSLSLSLFALSLSIRSVSLSLRSVSPSSLCLFLFALALSLRSVSISSLCLSLFAVSLSSLSLSLRSVSLSALCRALSIPRRAPQAWRCS